MSAAKRAKLTEEKETEEKKFVIKHVFENFDSWEMNEERFGEVEHHFDVSWSISVLKWRTVQGDDCSFSLYLTTDPDLEINGDYRLKAHVNTRVHREPRGEYWIDSGLDIDQGEVKQLFTPILCDGTDRKVTIECHVQIQKLTGIEKAPVLRKFDESNQEFSDVVLIIKGEKFYVCKKFLASHSAFFNSTFFGKFDEAQKAEIELKDIDPKDFQVFLELIHGDSLVLDSTVEPILNLADYFECKTAFKRCEQFLLETSQRTAKKKFELAHNYKLEKQMKKCLSEIKSRDDIREIVSKYLGELDQKVANELLRKSLSFEN